MLPFFTSIFNSCCGLVVSSESVTFRGRIIVNDSIGAGYSKIYANKNPIDFSKGPIPSYLRELKADSNGVFFLRMTTPSHSDCESSHDFWKSGPIYLYVFNYGYKDYSGIIGPDEIRKFQKLGFKEAGIEQLNQDLGVYVIPDIKLESL